MGKQQQEAEQKGTPRILMNGGQIIWRGPVSLKGEMIEVEVDVSAGLARLPQGFWQPTVNTLAPAVQAGLVCGAFHKIINHGSVTLAQELDDDQKAEVG